MCGVFYYSLVHLHCLIMYKKLSLLTQHSAHATTVIFVLGFLFDMVILPDIDHAMTRYLGGFYLCLIAFLIFFREWLVSRNTASSFEQKLYSLTTFGVSYFSGSALSFVCIYAIRSATFSVSWPLFLLLFLCILANELVSTHTFRFTLDIGVLIIAASFYVIFNIPVLLKVQNDTIFMLSVLVSAIIALLYAYLLRFSSESAENEAPRVYALAVGIPFFIGMLYFLNVLPAVPLSLANEGVYHSIFRNEAGDYVAEEEKDTRMFLSIRQPLYHISSTNTGVYFFSAIDAPLQLSAPISHVWEYYNEGTKKWEVSSVISFTLEGGRENGYRAYSYKENATEGLWRVTVKVDAKRIVGRMKFYVKKSKDVDIPLTTVTL